MTKRRQTKQVRVGDVLIGGDAPISIQSMVKADAHNVAACVQQILELEEAGCDLVRLGFLDLESVRNISAIKKQIHIPLIADIHFDYRFALEALDQGFDKLRLNPGNIGGRDKVAAVVAKAKERQVPIRIGVNAGSLQKDLLKKYGGVTAQALVKSAAQHIKILEDLDYDQIVVSLKSSDVALMTAAYRLFAQKFNYPLHLGVTEAGGPLSSTVKSSIGIGSLLLDGIGDTLRVSLTGDNIQEIKIGREILKHLHLRAEPILISCPTCSRTQWDLIPTARRVEEYLQKIKRPLTVAVMGCAVNGPGEAAAADIGIAGGNGMGIIFVHGQVVATVPQAQLYDELIKRIEALPNN
ncbi:MAG: flavodoxin-dependent (E)-4-hydroxy-3-methylbut-2-enyl-diphosphate synthase [bacterium]|nr:flavodoxin-dependent (E)-4-hydroxy-3-methylbut-2-enyl-diphosphate synthase [bacterium]